MPHGIPTETSGGTTGQPKLLQANGLSKSYGENKVVDHVTFSLDCGEVIALVGENGAGKSTLMNMLAGVVSPDEGEIILAGRPVSLSSPHAAQSAGIGMVFQELSLVGNLSVKENLFAGRAPTRFGLIDGGKLRRKAQGLLQALGVAIDPDALVSDLPMSSRQIVEIAKAVSLDTRLLLLDEPTSALNADEKAMLFRLISELKAKGVGIVYISHHLNEVLELADRVVVLRDGRVVSIAPRAQVTIRSLVRDMVGRAISLNETAQAPPSGRSILEVDRVSGGGGVTDVSLRIEEGEIVGIAGLVGSGRTELARMIVGLSAPKAGSVKVAGQTVRGGGMAAAKRSGIAYVPPERKTEGLFLDLPVAANIAAATLEQSMVAGFLRDRHVERRARHQIDRLGIKARSPGVACRSLSGGNQQKVLLAKWLETRPRLLVVDEPTKGVDVAAKADIHSALRQLAASGAGILMVSSDLPEILSTAHRVLVMHKGRVVANLACAETSEQEIIAHASGLPDSSAAT